MIEEIEPSSEISPEKSDIHIIEESAPKNDKDKNKQIKDIKEIKDNKNEIKENKEKETKENKDYELNKENDLNKENINPLEIKEPQMVNEPITIDKTTTDALFKELNITISKYSLTTNKWKAKYYVLDKKSEWTDMGIGYIFCSKTDDYQKLIMLSYESGREEEKLSLDLKKDNNIIFHKQRGTIITWKQNKDLTEDDSAISFQEKQGFLEVYRNILICEGKDPDKEPSLLEDDDENVIFEVTSENLPNLIREFGKDMGEERMCRFIVYLRENNNGFVKEMGKLLDDEEKKIEAGSGLSTSSELSVSGNNNLNNSSNN